MAQVEAAKRHSTLLLNFAEYEAEIIRKAGFNVDLGVIGAASGSIVARAANSGPLFSYFFPRPLYEYDVLVYNSAYDRKEVSKLFPFPKKAPLDDGMFEPLLVLAGASPFVRIAFIGVPSGLKSLVLAGLPFLGLAPAHEGVSVFDPCEETHGRVPDLTQAIVSLQRNIATPVGQYLSCCEQNIHPLSHVPVIINRNGDEIAAYGTLWRGRTVPAYVVLPQLKNNALGLARVLEELARLRPEVFPDRENRDWYGGKEFAFKEENEIDREIESRVEELNQFCEQQQQQKAAIATRLAFMKKILVAREDQSLPPDDRLAVNVRMTLEFLGFEVEDIDARIKGAIRKEDFWVKDREGFLAITEVTGTNAKNPKTKEFNDLLGRMATIFKRRDLVPEASNISGLLIVNYDIDTNPRQRPKLYRGDSEEIVAAARDRSIGLLSTVNLYDIAVAVKDGTITAEQGRTLIKGFGRIEFGVAEVEKSPSA
jgi:hypothetical protein